MNVTSLAIGVVISIFLALPAHAEKTWTKVENMDCKFKNPKLTPGEKVYWLGDCSDSGLILGIGKLIFYIDGRPIEGHLFDFTNGTADGWGITEQYTKNLMLYSFSLRVDWYEQAKMVVLKDGNVIGVAGNGNVNFKKFDQEMKDGFNEMKSMESKKVKQFCVAAQKWKAPRDVIEVGHITCRNFGYE